MSTYSLILFIKKDLQFTDTQSDAWLELGFTTFGFKYKHKSVNLIYVCKQVISSFAAIRCVME